MSKKIITKIIFIILISSSCSENDDSKSISSVAPVKATIVGITSHKNGTVLNSNSVDLVGFCSISGTGVVVSGDLVEDAVTPCNEGVFSITVVLHNGDGAKDITVSQRNINGNEFKEILNIILDTPSPAQLVFHSIRCQAGFGPGRITANLRAQGSLFYDGVFEIAPDSPLLPHGSPGGGGRVYMGASTVGDIIEVRPISSNVAYVSLHLCEQRSLIMPGRHVVQAYIDVGRGIILKSRPNCEVDEVTAANLMVYLGPYREYSGTQYPLSFTRVQDIAPNLCSGGGGYWP